MQAYNPTNTDQCSVESRLQQSLEVSAQFADFFSTHRIQALSPQIRRHLTLLLTQDGIDPQQLAWAALDQLQLPWITELTADAGRGDLASVARKLQDDECLKQLDEDLLHALLRRTIVTDLALERLITLLRRIFLQWNEEKVPAQDARCLRLMASIAAQTFNNEYINATSAYEDAALERLSARLRHQLRSGREFGDLGSLIAYAMYGSLRTLEADEALMQLPGQCESRLIEELVVRQVKESLEEERIRKDIPSIGLSEDSTSMAVRRQYEESPFPRWFTFQRPAPVSFASAMTERFPFLDRIQSGNPLSILIAGCGTGWHAMTVATRYQDADVHALDLSKASLAYGIRQSRTCGVRNVTFCHGDILCLRKLGEKFDVIEAVGVVHHMADPVAGIRALAGQLNPGGFMKFGIYSRRARRELTSAQAFVSARSGACSPPMLRSARQELISGEMPAGNLFQSVDFFYLSGFRDLLCHVREVRFTPAELKPLLSQLGLSFLGFRSVDKEKRKTYVEQFPQDTGMRNLDLVEAFEVEHPDLFGSMMTFWVQKAS